MKDKLRDYEAVKLSLEEARDNLEAMIWDCKESAKDEEDRILDDAREARYYADELEQIMKDHRFPTEISKLLKLLIYWLNSVAVRKEEVR